MPKSTVCIQIADAQWAQIEDDHPDTGSSSAVGRRAEALARLYICSVYPQCEFGTPDNGADLAVVYQGVKLNFEVKGTRSNSINWSQLKVSSPHTHRLILSGMPMLRIASVFLRCPVVHVLSYPNDFELREEPRWSVHAV